MIQSRLQSIPLLGLAALSAALLTTTPASAYAEADYDAANKHLLAANAGDKSAIPAAIEKFGGLSKAEPTNPLLLVNLGAVTSMQSRTTMLPWKKISYAEDGLALQDRALALLAPAQDTELHNGTPVSLLVRYVASNTFLAVPGFFNRGAQGGKLMNEILTNPMFETSPLQFKGTVWMRAARWADDDKRQDDVKHFLNLVITNNAPQAGAAKTQLGMLR